jgi:hypothetical protein
VGKDSTGERMSVHFSGFGVHRGGWVMGSRKTNLPLMIKLAEEGYAPVRFSTSFTQQWQTAHRPTAGLSSRGVEVIDCHSTAMSGR